MVGNVKRGGRRSGMGPVGLRVGDEMMGTIHLRERRGGQPGERGREIYLVRVRGGVMGLLRGDPGKLNALDIDVRVRVRLLRIDEPDAMRHRKSYVFELVSQQRPSLPPSSELPEVGISTAAARPASPQYKPVPSIENLGAFQAYGIGLLKARVRDEKMFSVVVRDWLNKAALGLQQYGREIRSKEGAVMTPEMFQRYQHYEGIYLTAHRIQMRIREYVPEFRDRVDFYYYLRLRDRRDRLKIGSAIYTERGW